MATEGGGNNRKFELWGWSLFIVSAVFFVASTAISGDVPGLFGSLFFLAACIVFLAPYLRSAE